MESKCCFFENLVHVDLVVYVVKIPLTTGAKVYIKFLFMTEFFLFVFSFFFLRYFYLLFSKTLNHKLAGFVLEIFSLVQQIVYCINTKYCCYN